MKKQTQDNPYKAFNEFMIRQSVRLSAAGKIDDNDQNEFRAAQTHKRGRSVDIEFFDGEFEEDLIAEKQQVFNSVKTILRAVPLDARVRNTQSSKGAGKAKVRIKKDSGDSDSADREGFSEKRESTRRRKINHDEDGLESAEEKDPVHVVSGDLNTRRGNEFSARQSG
jgi:hypothetical protein